MKLINFFKFLCLLLSSSFFLVSCNNSQDLPENRFCPNKSFKCIYEKKTLEVITNKGSIIIEINGNLAPLTAGNFLDLVEKGIYVNTTFNNVIKDPKPFVIIGGDPSRKANSIKKTLIKGGNYIDPIKGYSRFIPLEISLKNEPFPRYNQLMKAQLINRVSLKHQKGSIAMSRSESLDSASAQFYISLRDLPELDGRYAVFGKVIKGLDLLENIEEGDYILSIENI